MRREVKRYHQRKLQNAQRADARRRDDKLFLFAAVGNGPVGFPWLRDEAEPVSPSTALPLTAPPSGNGDDDDWAFDFVFRPKAASGFEESFMSTGEATTYRHEAAVVPPSFYAELNEEYVKRTATLLSELPVDSTPPTTQSSAATAAKRCSTIAVQREEGVPAIPVETPMPPGTDLNIPTSNYLALDLVHNAHQHAPGFQRDETVALRSLLSSAMMGWQKIKGDLLVLSTGAAMRSVFEQTYNDSRPLALKVQRVGPALVIDAHTECDPPRSVRDLREKALLGKALYRLEEDGVSPSANGTVTAAAGNDTPLPMSMRTSTDRVEEAATEGTVAVPVQRVGTVAVCPQEDAVSRYSQLLRWDIDDVEVLVGVDTPIILDRRSGTEQLLKLEDTSEPMTSADIQRDVLNCWFDATLANVPQVGIYIHNAGVVQRFEVKKVQELLGLVEGRIATAAMKFTSNVLQWLAQECVRDDCTYAVIRGYGSDYLQLYEVPRQGGPFPDLMQDDLMVDTYDNDRDVKGKKEHTGCHCTVPADECSEVTARRREESRRLNLNLARMCCGMGQHLYQKGSPDKAHDALALLLRSLVIFLQQSETERVTAVVKMLPNLVAHVVAERQGPAAVEKRPRGPRDPGGCPSAPPCPSPEGFREALLTCGRFEARLRLALRDSTLTPIVRRKYVQSLLPCSSALCVVVAGALELFTTERLVCLHGTSTLQLTSAAGNRSKDLLQVVVEGLVRLEHLSDTIGGFVRSQTPRGGTAEATAPQPSAKPDVEGRTTTPAPSMPACDALVDPATDIDITPLHASLCELYGDVVLLAVADPTPFTATILSEIGQRIVSRTEGYTNAATTLAWLSGLTHDPVSLSFTAQRFYTKAGNQTRRVIVKTGQVYYYVGLHHLQTDRYTKALEALHRAKSLFSASHQAPDDIAYGGGFTAAPLIGIHDVLRSLGDVYMRMVSLKERTSVRTTTVVVTPSQPLCIGLVHHVTEEEVKFNQQAIDFYMEGGWERLKSGALVHYAASQIDMIALSGVAADRSAALHIYGLLVEGKGPTPCAHREQALLRLATATAPAHLSGGWMKEVQATVQRWTQLLCERIGDHGGSEPLPVRALEMNLQLSLFHCVSAEHVVCTATAATSGAVKSAATVSLHSTARLCIGFVIAALDILATTEAEEDGSDPLQAVAAIWGATTVHWWGYRMATMIAARVLRAVTTPPPMQGSSRAHATRTRTAAAQVFRQVLSLESTVSCDEELAVERLIALREVLLPCLRW